MSTSRPRRRGAWIAGAALLAAVVGGGVAVHVGTAPEATIGGHAVSAEVYGTYAELVQDATGSATDPARASVLQQIARDQALLDLARDAGLADVPRTPADLFDLRAGVNQGYEDAREQGQVVYGSGDYTPAEFHSRTVAQLRAATVRALSDDPRLQVTDAEVAAEFAADPGRWSAAATTYHFSTYTVPGTVGTESGDAVLDRAAAGGVDPSTAGSLLPAAAVGSTDVSATDVRSSGLGPDAEAALSTLAPGQYLPPQSAQGNWVLYRLTSLTRDDAAALSGYAAQIRQVLVERTFDDLVDTTADRLLGDQS